MICLTGARFTMSAEVLHWQGVTKPVEGIDSDAGPSGHWESAQDPISGEIRNVWVPELITPDDPSTPENDRVVKTIRCLARGIVDGGIRMSGSSEVFGDTYTNVEIVRLWTPANVKLTRRDRITNIRDGKSGNILWADEEDVPQLRPTVFNVNGVTPLFDAFNRHIENFVLLEKADSNTAQNEVL